MWGTKFKNFVRTQKNNMEIANEKSRINRCKFLNACWVAVGRKCGLDS
jgi:hypothetical protein